MRALRLGVGVVAAAVLVAACSSSGGGGGTSPTPAAAGPGSSSSSAVSSRSGAPSASTSTTAAGAPIKVGFLCSCSGTFGYIGQGARKVYDSWVKSVNATGGINGHPIQVIYSDDALDPGKALTNAKQALSEGAVALVSATALEATWQSTVEKAKVPVVGAIITSPQFYSSTDFFPEGETNNSLGDAVAATIKASGGKKFGQIYCVEAPQCQQAVPIIKKAATAIGLQDVLDTQVSATAPNYTAQCVAAKQAGVQTVFIGDGAPVIARIAADCSTQGYHPAYVIEGNSISPLTTSAPGLSDNLWAQFNNFPYFVDAPQVRTMNAAVDKYYPGERNNQTEWTQQGVGSWAAGLLLEDAVKRGGLKPGDTPSSAEILQGLHETKNDTLQGWAPALTFTNGKPASVDCWFMAHIDHKTPKLVNGGKLSCKNPS